MEFYSIRREIRIRPGFTPQEDVTRFRGTRQTQMDQIALPAGHILGWVAPSGASKPKSTEAGSSMSKSAKKNEKRKGKRDKKKEEIIRANWEDIKANWEEDVVKDADGAPNWAETAKAQAHIPHEPTELGEETMAEGAEPPTAKSHGDGEPLKHGREDLDEKLEHLDIR